MRTVKLGFSDQSIPAAGLGCMAMSGGYGTPDDAESIATIHAALEAGITLIDTGDFYGMGHNEMLIGEALKGGKRERAFVSVKFGALRSPDGGWTGYDLRPAGVKNFLAYTLRRLGTDYIDLYQPARYDRTVPIEDTLGAISDLVKAGYVRHIGLSEVSARTLKRAAQNFPIAALQIEYSLASRGIEKSILPAARARHSGGRLRCALARAPQRRDTLRRRGGGRHPQPHATLCRRELRTQPRAGRRAR
jgi:pyridoxine 4-dehydrogenase